MSYLGYIWSEKNGTIGVIPAESHSFIWQEWIARQDINICKKVKEDELEYWSLDHSLMSEVWNRFIAAGWVVSANKPKDGFYKKSGFQGRIQNSSNKQNLDPFNVLHVQPDAPKIVVDAAYRALIREVHPDSHQTKESEEETKILNEARDSIYQSKGW